MDIGARIRALRTERGITQEQLGRAIGMTKQGVYELEKRRSVQLIRARTVAEALGVTLAELGVADDSSKALSKRPRLIPLTGSIGDDGALLRSGDVMQELVPVLPGIEGDQVEVYRVVTSSLAPRLRYGEYAFIARDEANPADMIGEYCLVRLSDGRELLREIMPGHAPGTWRLRAAALPEVEVSNLVSVSPVLGTLHQAGQRLLAGAGQ